MKLFEFFGKPLTDPAMDKHQDDHGITDEVFWFIVDHSKLYKDYFIPLAAKIKAASAKSEPDREKTVKLFLPMVNKGCMEFYYKNKMSGNQRTIFPKEMRQELCEKLYDHYRDEIFGKQTN